MGHYTDNKSYNHIWYIIEHVIHTLFKRKGWRTCWSRLGGGSRRGGGEVIWNYDIFVLMQLLKLSKGWWSGCLKGNSYGLPVDNSCDYRMWRLLLSLCPLAHFTNSGQYKIHAVPVRTHVNICCNTYWACEVHKESVWESRT